MVLLYNLLFAFAWFSTCTRVTGFKEDGFSSFLKQSVEFVQGWKEVSAWKMSGASGFFSLTTSHFPPKFVVRNAGIYYVSGNFFISGANTSLVKVSISVNLRFEEPNGLTARFGNTTEDGTVALSGFLLLYESDTLSVAISGSEGTLLKFSTFSVSRLAQMATVPGVHAVLARKMDGFLTEKRLEDWRTSGKKGLFTSSTGFSPSTGKFCAICDGLYKYASNMNFESVEEDGNSTILLVLNKKHVVARYYASGSEKHTGSIDGLLRLRKGDCIELRIHSAYSVTEDSSFSVLYLGAEHSNVPAFSVRLGNFSQIKDNDDWQLVTGWNDVSSDGFFESRLDILSAQTTFSPTKRGFYLISVLLNFELDGSMDTNTISCLITASDRSPGSGDIDGILATKTVSTGNTSINVRGVVSLEGGQINIYVRQAGKAIIARNFSGIFSASFITYDYVGIAATLLNPKPIKVSDWTDLTDWQTADGTGFFPLHDPSLTTSGRYQVYLDGTYYVSSSILMYGKEEASLEALITIDREIGPRNGLYFYQGSSNGNATLNVMGSLKLCENQTVSVSVRVRGSLSWTVQRETSFDVVLNGAGQIPSDGVPGFLAVKSRADAFTHGAWRELSAWSTDKRDNNAVFQTGSAFSSQTGRFTSPFANNAVYLISLGIVISHNESGSFQVQVRINGAEGHPTPISLDRYSLGVASGKRMLTLSTSGTARLSESDYLSAFIRTDSIGTCFVEPNSTLSIVLIGKEDNEHFAGLLATGLIFTKNKHKFKLNIWTANKGRREDTFTESVDLIGGSIIFEAVQIEIPGLYIAQSVVVVENVVSVNYTGTVSLCIGGEFSGNRVIGVADLPSGKVVTFGVFGLFQLRKSQKLSVCFESDGTAKILKKSVFSVARLLPWKQPPGVQHNLLPDQKETTIGQEWTSHGFASEYERGEILKAITSTPTPTQQLRIPVDGIYFISVSLQLYVGAVENQRVCIGDQECSSCKLKALIPVGKGITTLDLVSFLKLDAGTELSTCFNGSRKIRTGRRSVQLFTAADANTFTVLVHNSTSFHAEGWHNLTNWSTSEGKVGMPPIHLPGLYLVVINMIVRAHKPGDEVSVKVDTNNSEVQQVLHASIISSDGSNTSFTAAGIARLTQGDVFSVLLYASGPVLLPDIQPEPATFQFVMLNDDMVKCFALRHSEPMQLNVVSEWRTTIEGRWVAADPQYCPKSLGEKGGRFVSENNGVYFVTATIRFRLDHRNNSRPERIVTLSVDVGSSDSLEAVQSARSGDVITLSVTSTVYLTKWQTVSLSLKCDQLQSLVVLENSTFYVVLIDEDHNFQSPNVLCHDSGPRVVTNAPPFVSLPADLHRQILWKCDVVSEHSVDVKWLKDNEVINVTGKQLRHNSSSFIIFSSTVDRRNVNVNDSGRYFCVAEANNVSVASQATLLEVYVIPQFSERPRDLIVIEGQNATFPCIASGLPSPILRWNFSGGSLPEHKIENGALTLLSVENRPRFEGRYTCTASSRVGTSSVDAVLVVDALPRILLPLRDIIVEVGTTLVLTCNASADPAAQISWMKDGSPLGPRAQTDQSNSTLIMPNATIEDDGRYTCVATNRQGNASSSANVEVQKRHHLDLQEPHTLKLKNDTKNITVACHGYGKPLPHVVWKKNGNVIKNVSVYSEAYKDQAVQVLERVSSSHWNITSRLYLRVGGITYNESGNYTCVVFNGVGTNYSEQQSIEVLFIPEFTERPSARLIIEEQNVTFSCKASGIPEPLIGWSFSGGSLPDHGTHHGTLTLYKVQNTAEYEGRYTCTATSRAGSSSANATLVVDAFPRILSPLKDTTIQIEERLVLVCNASADPIAQISWMKDILSLPSRAKLEIGNSTLVIESTSFDDNGEYSCMATNRQGNVSSRATVEVQVPSEVFLSGPATRIFKRGDKNVSVVCYGRGHPLPNVTWTKGSRETIPQMTDVSMNNNSYHVVQVVSENVTSYPDNVTSRFYLRTSGLTYKEAGNYSCTSSNGVGGPNRTGVEILFEPEFVTRPRSQTATEGSEVQFYCRTSGVPRPRTTWLFSGGALPPHRVVDGNLFINSVTNNASYEGNYTCAAGSRAGDIRFTVSLTVHVPPTMITKLNKSVVAERGQVVNLTCLASGDPPPVYTWTKNGITLDASVHLENGNRSLVLRSVTPKEDGLFTCLAVNEAGNVSTSTNLSVHVSEPSAAPRSDDTSLVVLRTTLIVCGVVFLLVVTAIAVRCTRRRRQSFIIHAEGSSTEKYGEFCNEADTAL